jgi:hypothetical protein
MTPGRGPQAACRGNATALGDKAYGGAGEEARQAEGGRVALWPTESRGRHDGLQKSIGRLLDRQATDADAVLNRAGKTAVKVPSPLSRNTESWLRLVPPVTKSGLPNRATPAFAGHTLVYVHANILLVVHLGAPFRRS